MYQYINVEIYIYIYNTDMLLGLVGSRVKFDNIDIIFFSCWVK